MIEKRSIEEFYSLLAPTARLANYPWNTIRPRILPTAHEDDIYVAAYASSGFNGTDDDSAAVLAARDALVARGRGRLIFPQRCRLREPLTIPRTLGPYNGQGNSYVLQGDDSNGTLLYWDPLPEHVAATAITFGGTGNPGEYSIGGGIRDILLAGVGSPTGVGINLNCAVYPVLERVEVRGFDGTGGTGFLFSSDVTDLSAWHVQAHTCYTGFDVNGLWASVLAGCKANACTEHGILLRGAHSFLWAGGLVQANPRYGVRIAPGSSGAVTGTVFVGVHAEVGSGTEAVIRTDTNTSTHFQWLGGRFTGGNSNPTLIYFDFQGGTIDFVIQQPRFMHAAGQKIVRISHANAYGAIDVGQAYDSSWFDIDSGARINWRNGLGMSFSPTTPPAAGVAIDCGTNKVFKAPRVTTTQRDALTAAAGDIVYNTTASTYQGYNGTAWHSTANSYQADFTNASLSAGVLTVTHNLNSTVGHVVIKDNAGAARTLPDSAVTFTSSTALTVDLSSFGALTGTWTVLVVR